MFHSGQKIGHYTLIAKLGHGGFGEVWLAEKRSEFVTKKVAVKLPHQGQINLVAIRQEATLWEQASGHPNVLPIIDADILDGQVVIVSEYADGGSLADKLARDGMLSLKQAVEMTVGILSGLEFLHERKIIHRDIKPQNILLQGKTPRLADFGISRAMQATMVSSAIIGTDAYMSPEAFDGKRNAQTDIWSVGVVLYQLIKGSLPFPQDHPSERMFAVLTKEFEPLPPEIPTDLRRIVSKALEKEPSNRYASAEEMREDLQKALIGIAHPTLAKTEVLNQSTFPIETVNETPKPSDAPTVALNNLTEATEIKTVVNKQSNQPAPTEAAVQTDSVATQFRQSVPAETNQVPDKPEMSRFFVPAVVGVFALVIGFFLLIYVLAAYNNPKSSSSNSNSPLKAGTNPTPNPYQIYTPLTRFKDGNKYGYTSDKDKSIVIPAQYDEAEYSFSGGFAGVKLDGKWAHIDAKGNLLYPFKYNYAYSFSEGIAFVRQGEKWGAIDNTGKEIFPFIYEDGSLFSDGLAPVKLNGKKGYIDRTGKEVIPFKYYDVGYFKSGLSYGCIGDYKSRQCAVIDKTGKELTPYKYDFIHDFYDNVAMVKLGEKYGFIDLSGKEIAPLIYDEYLTLESGGSIMRRGDRRYRVDVNGKETDIGAVTPTPSSTYSANTTTTNATNTNTTSVSPSR